MNQTWLEAASRYEEQNRKKAAEKEAEKLKSLEAQRQHDADVAMAIVELEAFLASADWEAAQRLLAVSGGQRVPICSGEEDGYYWITYCLDSFGFRKYISTRGSNERAEQAEVKSVAFWALQGGLKSSQVMEIIREELNKIAQKVL